MFKHHYSLVLNAYGMLIKPILIYFRSETINTSIRTMPLSRSDIILINSNADVTTKLKLRYTQTPQTKSLFDTYR